MTERLPYDGETDCFLVPATVTVENGRIVAIRINERTRAALIECTRDFYGEHLAMSIVSRLSHPAPEKETA